MTEIKYLSFLFSRYKKNHVPALNCRIKNLYLVGILLTPKGIILIFIYTVIEVTCM